MHYTHGHHESVLRSHRWRTAENSAAHLLPHLTPATTLLDVGCGPGTITADLAARVARVTATEIGPDELGLARAEAERRGTPNIAFEVADAHALPYGDKAFDVAHAHQVLQHLADPVRALREMGRVARLVAARDSDYGAFTWYPALPELDEWLALYYAVARRNDGEPDAGRRMLSWARAAGFTDIEVSTSTWTFATPGDRAFWGGMWADRVVRSSLGRQAVDAGLATPEDLRRIADGWLTWAADPDGFLTIVHGEVLCRA